MFEKLPNEILVEIGNKLDQKNLIAISSTSKLLREIFFGFNLVPLYETLLKGKNYSCEIVVRDKGIGFFSQNIKLVKKQFNISLTETEAVISGEENIKNFYKIIIKIENFTNTLYVSPEIIHECALILILSAQEKLILIENDNYKKVNKKLIEGLPSMIMRSLYLKKDKLNIELNMFEENLKEVIKQKREYLKHLKKFDPSYRIGGKESYKKYLGTYADMSKGVALMKVLIGVIRYVSKTTEDHIENHSSRIASTYVKK